MKKLLIMLLSIIVLNTAYADDNAKLRMKISGPIQDNRYFLCVSQVGCVSILNGNKGRAYPMNAGNVNNIVAINLVDHGMHPQKLPNSCSVTIDKNQTMTVSGKLIKGANNKVVIANLRCTIA